MSSGNKHSAEQEVLARVREQRRTLEGLTRVGPEGLSPERLMQHVAAQVSRVTHIEHTKIMRYRRAEGDLLIEAGVGWDFGVVGNTTLSIDYRSPAGRALQTAAPVAIQHISEATEFEMPDLLRAHGIVCLLNVPVMINGETWGVLEVDSTQPHKFDDWDVSFLVSVANLMGTCLALTDAKQKNIEAAAQAARERAKFDVLIRESHHRIKNNIQIIIAFLTKKFREFDPDIQERLDGVIARIQAVGLAHDLLSTGKKHSSVDFDDYLHSLCANLRPQRPDVSIDVAADRITIPIDRAVPAGLVVNELVTNSMKYAFRNDGGRIKVHFSLVGNASEACVAVEDDGPGLDIPPKRGFGLTLVEAFAQQIQGRVEYEKLDPGSRIKLCFPVVA
jgi:two-component sensor histidine kinase